MKLGFVVIWLLLAVELPAREAAPVSAAPTVLVEKRGPLALGGLAPLFAIPAGENGVVSLRGELAQGPLLLSFWASWCTPCKEGLKRVDAWRKARLRLGQPLPRVLCVNHADERARASAMWQDLGLDLPMVMDRYGTVGERYGLTEGSSLPLTVFIDQDVRIRALIVAEGEDLPAVLDSLMLKVKQ